MLTAPLVITQVPTVRGAVFSLAATMQTGGLYGLCLYLVVCAAGSVLTVPLWMLSGLAGFAYGFPYAVGAALPGITLGACCAFFIGRGLARTSLGDALRDHPRFRMIEAVVRHDGRRIATLLRVTPVMPQNLLHYALGATALPARDFALATFTGLIPVTCVQAYAGSLLHDATELFRQGGTSLRDPLTWAKALGGIALTAAVLTLVVRRAQKALAVAVAEAEHNGRAP